MSNVGKRYNVEDASKNYDVIVIGFTFEGWEEGSRIRATLYCRWVYS